MEDHFRHWTRRLIYTSGVKFLCDEAGAHWLVDAIASYQGQPEVKAEEFQVWRLRVADTSATLTMTDGNTDKPIVTQAIGHTDFAEPEAEFYVVLSPGQPAVLMLPCEY